MSKPVQAVLLFVVMTLAIGTAAYFGKDLGAPAWEVYLIAAVFSAVGVIVRYIVTDD